MDENTNSSETPRETDRTGGADIVPGSDHLLADIRTLIETTRGRLARTVNTELANLYWSIGKRIRQDIIGEGRAEYGQQIVLTLSRKLAAEYGRGFSQPNVFHMIRFAEVFPENRIVQTLSAQLSWSHFLEIIYLKESVQREFYAQMCRVERWSVRTLRSKIDGMLYERTAISRKPDELALTEIKALRESDRMTPDLVFRDPYILDFLGLKDTYSERDLESAILAELESFLLEMGNDFAFVARQKRMTIGSEDFYLDLLFYHRRLRRLVAVELKLGRFSASYKGQMELYLRWLEQNDLCPGEEPPIGLILCSGRNWEQIELLRLDQGEIRVAEYLTELPAADLLKARLHEAVRTARERLRPMNATDVEALPSDVTADG